MKSSRNSAKSGVSNFFIPLYFLTSVSSSSWFVLEIEMAYTVSLTGFIVQPNTVMTFCQYKENTLPLFYLKDTTFSQLCHTQFD